MKRILVLVLSIIGTVAQANGQLHTDNKSDQVLRGSGRVNASTLGMEIDIPLASYPGRGINIPVSLSYSSKVWRMRYVTHMPSVNNPENCKSINNPMYSEKSASGWTTSVAVPYIEYTGSTSPFDSQGRPAGSDADLCLPNPPPSYGGTTYVKRINIHLPSGETHELRDDTATAVGSFPASFNGTYYAADGSNLKFVQDSATGLYRLLMPDGSYYDFSGTTYQATRYTDRNGNFTTYNAPTTQYPNGSWTDTLGRTIAVPFGLSAPGEPIVQTYSVPGMTGTYKFHWKKLKGNSAEESAITNFDPNIPLKYWGDKHYANNQWETRAAETFLFGSTWGAWVIEEDDYFNPILLNEIELPTGQKYRFTYDFYGRIERIYYPTGGEERFVYGLIPTLAPADPEDINWMTNFGVTNRKVYQTAGQGTPYEWVYSAQEHGLGAMRISTTSPDNTLYERYVHRSNQATTWGYDNALAGMPYEERVYDSSSPRKLVSKKLTSWTKSVIAAATSVGADWHPRVTQERSIVYDSTGINGVSAATTFEYEGDLNQRETPLLAKKTTQYAYEVVENPSDPPCDPEEEFCDPPPTPTPGPTPTPLPQPTSAPVKIVETTFLINDPNYAAVQNFYRSQNMVGLVTVSKIKNGGGVLQAQSEIVYDDTSNYPLVEPAPTPANWSSPPNGYRGNPNTVKAWKDVAANQHIATHAQFDIFGNQIKAWDAMGNLTETDYSTPTGEPDYKYAFPTRVLSPIPDPNPSQNPDQLTHGSQGSFETTTKFDWVTGLPKSTTDANGLKTEIEYDPVTLRPRYTRQFYQGNQVGSTSETIYHDETNNYWVKSRSQIDETKWAEAITYFDGLGRAWKTEEVNSNGNIYVEKEFDAEGRVKRVTNPFRSGETKHWTTNVYDEASRVKEVVLQDGATVKTDYGVSTTAPIGVTKTITDQAGKKRKGITDALGRMVRVIEDPTGQNLNTDYIFDTLGNLRQTIQGAQNRYFYHDSLGRLLYAKQPEQDTRSAFVATDPVTNNTQWSVKYEYDDNSNITKTTNARGIEVTGTYDKLNRIILRDYSDTTPDVGFYYDGTGLGGVPDRSKGKTTKVSSSVSETRLTSFDNLGRLLTHQQITDGQTYSTSYVYNLSGTLIEETYPSGRVVKNVLDNNGDLAIVQSKKNANAGFWNYADSFSYDSAGNVKKMQLGNGLWETSVYYTERLQIKQIGLGVTDADQNLLKLELGYGTSTQNNGSLREQKITVPGIANPFIQTYTYDDLNRLQSAQETNGGTETWKQTFTIDRFGNREFDVANTTTLGACPQAVCNPDINLGNDNRFSAGQGYGYDQNGNVTQDAEGQRFGYDAENHQKEFFAIGNGTSTPDATYLYDGDGRRVKKITSTEITVFVYNANGQLVAEYSTALATTPQVSYLTTDHLGSPRVVTNENGTVKDRKDYSAFGEESTSSQRSSNAEYTSADQLRQNYTGYEKDDESELEFAQARYYNPTHGRFTSIDPLTASASIRDPQTFNRYSYVLNSPYKFTDPLGLISETTGACGDRCQNSDGGGGGYTGRDASFDWTKQSTPPPPRPRTINVFVGVANEAEMKEWKEWAASAQAKDKKLTVNILTVGKDGTADKFLESLKAKDTVTIFSGHSAARGEERLGILFTPDMHIGNSQAKRDRKVSHTADGIDIQNNIAAVFSCGFGKGFENITSSNGAVFVSIVQGPEVTTVENAVNQSAFRFAKSVAESSWTPVAFQSNLNRALVAGQSGIAAFPHPTRPSVNQGDAVIPRALPRPKLKR